jgi:hypothetical protein
MVWLTRSRLPSVPQKARHPLIRPRRIDVRRAEEIDWSDPAMRVKLAAAYARFGANDEKVARMLGVSIGSAKLGQKAPFTPAAASAPWLLGADFAEYPIRLGLTEQPSLMPLPTSKARLDIMSSCRSVMGRRRSFHWHGCAAQPATHSGDKEIYASITG